MDDACRMGLRECFRNLVPDLFPRVLWLEEIPPLVGLHAEFTPLLERMTAIKAIDDGARARLIDPVERVKKFPLPPPLGRFGAGRWVPLGTPPREKAKRLREAWIQPWGRHRTLHTPFVLYLKDSSWSLHKSGIEAQALIEFELADGRPEGVELIVPVPFELTDDEWKRARRELISRADLIVLEQIHRTDDSLFELRTCLELDKVDHTLLILTSPQHDQPLLDAEEAIFVFLRVLWADSTERLMRNPAVADLAERIGRIADLPVESRKAYFHGSSNVRFPVTYGDLPDWYFATGARYVAMGEGLNLLDAQWPAGPLNRLAWWGAFWHNFRAAKLAYVLAETAVGDTKKDLLFIAAGGFHLAARLLTVYHDTVDGRLITGDLEYALAAAAMSQKLAADHGDMRDLEQHSHELTDTIAARQRLLKEKAAKSPVEPWFTLPLATASLKSWREKSLE